MDINFSKYIEDGVWNWSVDNRYVCGDYCTKKGKNKDRFNTKAELIEYFGLKNVHKIGEGFVTDKNKKIPTILYSGTIK